MMPKMLYSAARRDRRRFRDRLSDRRAAPAAHQGRRDPPRRDPRLQHRLGRLFRRARRPADPGRDHPDALPRGGDRRTRIRDQAARLEGRHVRQRHVAPAARADRQRHRALRRAGDRQPVRLRPGLGEMRRARHRADLPFERQRPGAAQFAVEFRLQPYRPFRRRRSCGVEGDLPRRRHKALPGTALCVPRRRGRLGGAALGRSDGALGAARRPGAGAHEARKARPQAVDGPRREARLRRHRRGIAGARRLAQPRHAGPHRQPRRDSTISPPARSPARRIGSICSQSRSISAARPTTA